MKNTLRFLVASILISLSFNNFAGNAPGNTNDTLTVSFKVKGTSSCKASIEQSLTSQTGVVSASWDANSSQITVTFLPAKIQQADLYTYLAVAGYDNAELRAKQPAYDALPSGCKYTRDPETE